MRISRTMAIQPLGAVAVAVVVLGLAAVEGQQAPGAPGAPEVQLRILSLMTVDTMSHHKFMAPLTVRLAERGHLVHSVDILPPERRPPTLNVTVLENAFKILKKMEQARKMMKSDWISWISIIRILLDFNLSECRDDFSTEALKTLVDPSFNQTFDLILVDYMGSDCLLGFAHRFNYPPVVVLTPFPFSYWIDMLMGNPHVPSISPMFFLPYKNPMTLLQRVVTTVSSALVNLHSYVYTQPHMDVILRETFGPAVPSAAELRKHVSLALVNEVPWMQSPRALPQSIVPVGGMHLQPTHLGNIPADLKKWLDDASDGFILVSFGSVMKSSNLDDKKRQAFLGAFAEMKQRVLWKFEDENIRELLPPNVRVEKWIPQNDILGHPNIRLFVSHCGGLSTLELVHHAVPVLGVPFIVDQFMNVQLMESAGMGRLLRQEDITQQRFVEEMREMVGNPVYRENAQLRSRLLRDQKEPPLERAVWWVEYVARHGGAPHLRSPALDLEWYQLMQLDVFAVLVLVLVAVLALCYLCLRTVRWRRRRSAARTKQD